jgi:hypothetical protein
MPEASKSVIHPVFISITTTTKSSIIYYVTRNLRRVKAVHAIYSKECDHYWKQLLDR